MNATESPLAPFVIGACIPRVAEFEPGLPISIVGGPDTTVPADQDQTEQVLINLVRNAVEANGETDGSVEIEWTAKDRWFEITIRDDGSGIADPDSLFIPFYTTKPEGSGIGLFLCRQIAEAHGGSVSVTNREDRSGCEAVLRLPLG